jgi:pimeloyl-ACP methyl ester carboxylesterase
LPPSTKGWRFATLPSNRCGVDSLRDYLRCVEAFTMDGRAELIRCPTLITHAENDPLASGAPAFFDALRCRKDLIRFTSAEGAGDHCEMMNRSLLNRKVLDWLDTVLGSQPGRV